MPYANDAVADIIIKLLLVILMIILVQQFFAPALGIFGILSCTGCDPLTAIVVMVLLPISATLILIYSIFKTFKR